MNILSCSMTSYGFIDGKGLFYLDEIFRHLMKIGVEYVEINDPGVSEAKNLREILANYGLQAATLGSGFNLADENVGENFSHAIESAEIMGASIIYTALHSAGLELPLVYERLHQVGDAVAKTDIKVSIETHPDLMHNGDVMLETMEGINHPNICVNFDTGNIYFYNEGRKAREEVEKVAQHIASVHLKDTYGAYWTHDFPTLGKGVVDFTEVFRILNETGFYGPFTMELEGVASEGELTAEEIKQSVLDSVAYLRQIGVVDVEAHGDEVALETHGENEVLEAPVRSMEYTEQYYTSGNYENYLKRKFADLAIDIANEINLTPNQSLVDYGCGYGGLLDEFWQMGFDNIYGTDISNWAINYGKLKFPHIADKLDTHTWERLTQGFDHLLLLDVLEHMPESDITALLNVANVRWMIVARIPVSAREGEEYVLDASNRDTTHICCHTRDWWIEFLDSNGYEFKGDIKRPSIYSSDGVLAGKWIKREAIAE